MRLLTSWDDGSREDFRIVDLLLKYGLPGIFFIPGNAKISESEVKEIHAKGFSIGGHTVTHPMDMKLLPDDVLFDEINDNKLWLEHLIGERVTEFCSPRGRFDQRVIDVLKKVEYNSNRTTIILNTDYPQDSYRIATTIHCYAGRPEYRGVDWIKIAKQKFDEAKAKDGYFHIWGHGWEIERDKLWDQVEEVLRYCSENYDARSNNT